jgi:hypothetical protein
MPVPNTFANATTSIPLLQLDNNFATPITIGNTAVQLGNTVTTLNNMTLANVTISSAFTPITVAQGGTGLSSLTAENVVLGNGANSVKVVAPGTSGNVLTSNGTSWISQTAGAASGNITLGNTTIALGGTASSVGNLTLTNGTYTNYIESVVAIGTVTTSNTLSLTNGTVQTATLTASTACTFTMPTATAGKSFILLLKQAATTGNGTATFTGVKYSGGTAPTITATAGRMDILTFTADGTNWYGSFIQNFTP